MNDRNFSKKLNEEAKLRESILDDAFKSLEDYSKRKLKSEKSIQKLKVDEIKNKTEINELNDYIEIYKSKIKTLENENDKLEKEVLPLRKKVLKSESDVTTLSSILQLFVDEYGIDKIVDITKLDKNKIESYLK